MKTLPIISVVIMAITIAVACDSDSEPQPKEIAFTEYSLLGTDCEWIQPENSNDVELVIIDSDEKLNNYIQSPTGKSRPAVDFSKCSLLPFMPEESRLCWTMTRPPGLCAWNFPISRC